MLKKEEIEQGLATLLKELRIRKGLSKFKMANALFIDDKTWARYESGQSAPSAAEFIHYFSILGEDALKPVLGLIYPEIYRDISPKSSADELRTAAVHYIKNVASDRFIREFDFIIFGRHGSNIEPQMQEFTMIDHLPLQYRVAIAKMVRVFWDLAVSRNELINPDNIMPDLSIFDDAVTAGEKACREFRNSYTTMVE